MFDDEQYALSSKAFDRCQVLNVPRKYWDTGNENWAKLAQMDWFKSPSSSPIDSSPVEPCVFSFTPSALAALKDTSSPRKCSLPQPTTALASTNGALKALIWRSIIVARASSPDENNDSTLHIPVSTRARLRPPISEDYLGNTALMIAVKPPFANLGDATPSMLADLTLAIHQAEQAVDADYIQDLLSFAEAVPDLEQLHKGRLAVYRPAIKMSDFSSMNDYKLDWGPVLGCIERKRFPAQSSPNGGVEIFPRLPDGIVEVSIGLSPAQMRFLKKDPLFTKFATVQNNPVAKVAGIGAKL